MKHQNHSKWRKCLATAFSIVLSTGALSPLESALADAAGAPGIPHHWAPALKQAVGTAYESQGAESPVWFTVAQGILTEVFYPSVDQAQVGDMQFIVTDGKSFFSEQKRDTITKVTYLDEGMTVLITGKDRAGHFSYEQKIVTDPSSPVVRIHTTFRNLPTGHRVFVLFKPAINNGGAQNLAYASEEGLFASKQGPLGRNKGGRFSRSLQPVHAALVPSKPFLATSVGYVGFSDGWQDLSRNFEITFPTQEAGPGNVALTGEIALAGGANKTFELALAFGSDSDSALLRAKNSLSKKFDSVRSGYESGWKGYLARLKTSSLLSGKRFFNSSASARRSAQIIKMHEDKMQRGAIVASLSKPGIPDSDNAYDGTGGYHLIWPRDLYHAGMGLMAAGDEQTPVDVLRLYVRSQRPDGSWFQNFWVDGAPYWKGLQMDEVSFPIVFAAHVKNRIRQLSNDELDMVRRAADFIMSHGPTTQQDRWEEIGGFVPSTLASEIAALRAATELTGDKRPAEVAHQWQSNIERWTLVNSGPYGSNYFLRTSLSGNPNSSELIDLANGAGRAYASEILDGGFLELVRLGVRGANDSNILNTLRIYESQGLGIAQGDASIQGMTYRRYNRDAYGAARVGGFWPLLAGERGHFAVAAGDLNRARAQLLVLEQSALEDSLLIPEQTISAPSLRRSPRAPAGLGVACPLVWAHAEDILLHRSIEEEAVFDAPKLTPAP